MPDPKPIRRALKAPTPLTPPAEPGPGEHFAPLAAAINAAYRERFGGAGLGANDAIALAAAVGDFLDVAAQLDAEYGADGVLPVRDAADAADEALRCATELDPWLDRFELASWRPALHAAVLGIGLWMIRHQLALGTPKPIVNALAFPANQAATRQGAPPAYALMQGFIAHLAPQLDAHLER